MGTTTRFYIRPSAFKISAKCPASTTLPQSPNSKEARVGQAFHFAVPMKLRGAPISKTGWDSIRRAYDLDDNDIKDLRITLAKVELNVPKDAITMIETTFNVLEGKLQGTPDLGIHFPEKKILDIIDWKYGLMPVDEAKDNWQGMCYSVGGYLSIPDIEQVNFHLVQPRLDSISKVTWLKDDLVRMAEWIEEKYDYIINNQTKFILGDHCSGCFKSMFCPAFKKQFQQIALIDGKDLEDKEKLIRLARMIKPIENSLKLVKEYMKKACDGNNGVLDLGNGDVYQKNPQMRDVIDSKKAYELLKTSSHIGDCVKITKSAIFDTFYDGKNQMEFLRNKGAISKKKVNRYEFQKLKTK